MTPGSDDGYAHCQASEKVNLMEHRGVFFFDGDRGVCVPKGQLFLAQSVSPKKLKPRTRFRRGGGGGNRGGFRAVKRRQFVISPVAALSIRTKDIYTP